MKMKKTTLYAVLAIVLIISFGFFLVNSRGWASSTESNDGGSNGDVQKVVIGMKSGNYYPQEIRVKVNQPVEIYLDGSVGGCLRDFTIRDFGIHQYLQTPQDKITFTPTKTGTFIFACSMGMGTGKLVVVE
ncbi:cupredoxin domain-containing protein [Candidatus Pacearchaeota archaeon]|nr:cupredoxin domain-containing protein [Candidatus Pacearchaeota archaeon]